MSVSVALQPVFTTAVFAPVIGAVSMASAFVLLRPVITSGGTHLSIATIVGLCATVGVFLVRRRIHGPLSPTAARNVWTSSAVVMGSTYLASQRFSLGFDFPFLAAVSAYSIVPLLVYALISGRRDNDADDDSDRS